MVLSDQLAIFCDTSLTCVTQIDHWPFPMTRPSPVTQNDHWPFPMAPPYLPILGFSKYPSLKYESDEIRINMYSVARRRKRASTHGVL